LIAAGALPEVHLGRLVIYFCARAFFTFDHGTIPTGDATTKIVNQGRETIES
jgi:hypothetical protein